MAASGVFNCRASSWYSSVAHHTDQLSQFKGERLTPAVLREGPYRFYFYSHEPNEPPHIHVDRDEQTAKFWLEPVGLAFNFGFGASELRRIESIVTRHKRELLEAWHDYFGA